MAAKKQFGNIVENVSKANKRERLTSLSDVFEDTPEGPVEQPAIIEKPVIKNQVQPKDENVKALAPNSTVKKRVKTIHDGFSMPEEDYKLIYDCMDRATLADHRCRVNKSEVLRAGLRCLLNLSDIDFMKAIRGVETLKKGRPAG